MSDSVRGKEVDVVFVKKKNAKVAKQALEAQNFLNKDYRMCPPPSTLSYHEDCIALPVLDTLDIDSFLNTENNGVAKDTIADIGRQVCPFSTKMLGNNRNSLETSASGQKLTLVQQAIVNTIKILMMAEQTNDDSDKIWIKEKERTMIEDIQNLDLNCCPTKLEFFGDDKTLVVPQNSFEGTEFDNIMFKYLEPKQSSDDVMQTELWKQLAILHGNSPRVVRRGIVDKESKIRESGHRLLYPMQTSSTASISTDDDIITTGPGSPGWITVTEQGIKQSLDMTRVMFSRGNISEKIRFGKLVQEGEIILDMYAGIGYYTLPALVIGKAAHVYSCEWNIHAANALKFNVKENHVQDRSTIFIGDCRHQAKQNNLVNMFDRVSLGLLPSSEGGWNTAVRGLNQDTGGWLHIHGNVPAKEMLDWSFWVTNSLKSIALEQGKFRTFQNNGDDKSSSSWVAICNHIEKVKSFAPTVFHYVADVYLGPADRFAASPGTQQDLNVQDGQAGVIVHDEFNLCPEAIEPPSCALSPDNVLSQQWMR